MQPIAVRVKPQGQSGTFYFVHTDRQGSVYTMRRGDGAWVNGNYARYDAYGGYRSTPSASVNPGISDRGYTGHRHNNTGSNDIGLIYMNARYYLPDIGRFISADTLVPDPANPQSYNRYTYVLNNPVNYTDPTGHRECIDQLCDLVWNEFTNRPNLRGPLPAAIGYIYEEMTENVTSATAFIIQYGNLFAEHGFPAIGKGLAYGAWVSQVMDARIRGALGPLGQYVANWDHKPILMDDETSPVPEIAALDGWSTVGSNQYRFDIWSNIHYGYVGAGSGFPTSELTNGAGIEQVGSDFVSSINALVQGRAPHWPSASPGPIRLSSWDDPSDTASIQVGASLWQQYGLTVAPADLYLAVLDASQLEHR